HSGAYARFNAIGISTSFITGTMSTVPLQRNQAHGNAITTYREPKEQFRGVWSSGDLAPLVNAYSSTEAYIAGDVHFAQSNTGDPLLITNNVSIVDDYLVLGV